MLYAGLLRRNIFILVLVCVNIITDALYKFFCPYTLNIYGRLVQCNVSTDPWFRMTPLHTPVIKCMAWLSTGRAIFFISIHITNFIIENNHNNDFCSVILCALTFVTRQHGVTFVFTPCDSHSRGYAATDSCNKKDTKSLNRKQIIRHTCICIINCVKLTAVQCITAYETSPKQSQSQRYRLSLTFPGSTKK